MSRFSADFFRENIKTKLFGRAFDVYEQVGSTNKDLLDKDVEPGHLIVANSQVAGVGRGSNVWVDVEDGLYFSLNLPITDVKHLTALNIIAGYAMVDVIRSKFNEDTFIKWPNDVLIKGKKVAGILINTKFSGNTLEKIVLGIGVNIGGKLHEDIESVATTVSDNSNRAVYKEVILALFLVKFEEYYELLIKSRYDIRASWYMYTACKGKSITITLKDVKKTYQEYNIDINGNLIVIDENRNMITVTSGEVGYDFNS